MPESWFLRGVIAAVIFGVPAGVIGALTLERTLRGGFRAGFVTGLGSTAADVLYAALGIFGLSLISDFLTRHQSVLQTASGVFIVILGVYVLLRRRKNAAPDRSTRGHVACFTTAFAIAAANPATMLSFFTAFAALGIQEVSSTASGVALILGIALGSTLWWALLAGGVSLFASKVKPRVLEWLDRLLGTGLIVFGLYTCLHTWLL